MYAQEARGKMLKVQYRHLSEIALARFFEIRTPYPDLVTQGIHNLHAGILRANAAQTQAGLVKAGRWDIAVTKAAVGLVKEELATERLLTDVVIARSTVPEELTDATITTSAKDLIANLHEGMEQELITTGWIIGCILQGRLEMNPPHDTAPVS